LWAKLTEEVNAMSTTVQTGDTGQLRQDAVEKIIFHATPKKWLRERGPWLLERGQGAFLYDADGREYLDAMAGGLFAVLAGYGREEIARAMYDQALKLNYTSPASVTSEVTIELARKLAELTPGDLGASFFCNSGSEAVEASIKLAHQYHEANGEGRRYKVVSLRRGYHGATVGALSATGWSPHFQEFRRAADPMVPASGFANAMPPYCYRCELGLTHPSCGLACATTIEQAILGSDPELVSCVILEPIMGTGGCIVPPPGYLAKVRQICDRYGVLLIADEVVCGFGRTGRWFGVDHFNVVPDIMVVAKGLTSGYARWRLPSPAARSQTRSRSSSTSTPTGDIRSLRRRRSPTSGSSSGKAWSRTRRRSAFTCSTSWMGSELTPPSVRSAAWASSWRSSYVTRSLMRTLRLTSMWPTRSPR
jgi:adenosylmethionine-8-amino-7-oxononanoate aminotransferase